MCVHVATAKVRERLKENPKLDIFQVYNEEYAKIIGK